LTRSVSEGPNKNPSLTFRVGTFIPVPRLMRNIKKRQRGNVPSSSLTLWVTNRPQDSANRLFHHPARVLGVVFLRIESNGARQHSKILFHGSSVIHFSEPSQLVGMFIPAGGLNGRGAAAIQ
ncbi:MAG: hypothetical protein KDB03_20500, partial [Planctomycetales bacterium]|nr:hypothetical protein [Planctomycetales bacterium]